MTDQAGRMSRARKLPGCYVISLRPVGDHAALRRAARAHGMRVLALSPWKIILRDDARTRAELRAALAADRIIVTSPAAARAARALHPLRARRGQAWCAVGSGTAAALRRAGIADVIAPARMDSEGLLALPVLRDVQGHAIGLITAPGGRNRIAPALRRRGAQVLRADVYDRVPVPPSARAIRALRALDARWLLALSSLEALERSLAALPGDVVARLRGARVLAASARLAGAATRHGFHDIGVAASARPGDLLAAAARDDQAHPIPCPRTFE